MKEPIGWHAQRVSQATVKNLDDLYWITNENHEILATVRASGRPIVDKRNAELMARAGRMQAAIKAVITSLDTGGESSRTLAREIAILRQSLK